MKAQLKIIDRFANRSIYGWYSEDGETLEEHIDALKATATRRLELLREIYEGHGVSLSSELIDKIEKELGDDYFNRHAT